MDDPTAKLLREARSAVDELEAALSSPLPQAHQRAVQALSYAVEEVVTILVGSSPDAPQVATGSAIISAACRVASAHGQRVAADANPADRAVIDAWAIGEALRRVPQDHLAPDARQHLLHALHALREFDTPRVQQMIRSNVRISEPELGELLRKLG